MIKAMGVDISHHQNTELDWQRMREAGYSFAFIRYGIGSSLDEWFERHLAGAQDAGILCGAYWYLYATDVLAQAALFATLDPNRLDLPMVCDVEETITEANLRLFLNEVERITGRIPIIYTRANIFDQITGSYDWDARYLLWVAQYPAAPIGEYPTALPKDWSNWTFWQFTSTGRVPGYSKDIDINYFNGTEEELCCRFAYPKVELFWPVDDPTITQDFGANPNYYTQFGFLGHEGLDLRAPTGANVYACDQGVVKAVGNSPSYGINVTIDHQNGLTSVYAHLQQSLVTIGNRVTKGQRIALADNTGNSSGSHLHFRLNLEHATDRKLASYPQNIINPTTLLKRPAQTGTIMRNKSGLVLNIRQEPSASSADIGDIPVNALVTALPPAINGYLKILYGGISWYSLEKQFEPAIQTVQLRSTAEPYVNIRSGPSTSSTDIGNLNFGETIMGYPIQGQEFWRVIFNNSEAWIASQWLEIV